MWSTADGIVNSIKSTQKVWYVTRNQREAQVRCPYCGDSRKNPRSAHLYIKLHVDADEPHTFYCQKCHSKGIVNSAFFKTLHIFDNELNHMIGLKNKAVAKGSKRSKFISVEKRKLDIPVPRRTKRNLVKLNYINKRLGIQLTLEDLPRMKIVLSLYELLDYNKIDFVTTKNDEFADTLDLNFIGFVSFDNNYLIMRNLSKKVMPNMRYHNYNIFDNYDNSKRFFILPNKVDILAPEVKVVLTEGIMDLYGVFHNFEGGRMENTIYGSICGTGYNHVIREIAKMGFLNQNINIYSDNDVPVAYFRHMKKEFKSFVPNRINLFYNKKPGEKDFGVRPDQVIITKTSV